MADEGRKRDLEARLTRWRGLALALGGVAILAAGAAALLATRGGGPGDEIDLAALEDPDVRAEVVNRLVSESTGVFDSFPDGDVAHVLLPDLEDRATGDVRVSSNAIGLRERDWRTPKPAGLVRVVLLGDSFVHGNGIAADERAGAFLEGYLRERKGAAAEVECLHVGVAAWNIRAECAFLRRQLSLLEPDLVVHVTVANDLDDNYVVRGFGVLADPGPASSGSGAIVATAHPWSMGFQADSWLEAGLDYESRSRYAAAGDAMLRLAGAVEERGGRYLALFFWPDALPVVAERVAGRLEPDQVAYVPAMLRRREWVVSKQDRHWNRAANEAVARMLYALIEARGLLPGLSLSPWDQAAEAAERLHEAGRRESEEEAPVLRGRSVRGRIDFASLDGAAAAQVHGGVDREGRVSPYASTILASPGAGRLVLRGSHLKRPELVGHARLFLDEVEVGRLPLGGGAAFDESYAIPASLADRAHLSVRLVADDWAYRGENLRRNAVLRLALVELVP